MGGIRLPYSVIQSGLSRSPILSHPGAKGDDALSEKYQWNRYLLNL